MCQCVRVLVYGWVFKWLYMCAFIHAHTFRCTLSQHDMPHWGDHENYHGQTNTNTHTTHGISSKIEAYAIAATAAAAVIPLVYDTWQAYSSWLYDYGTMETLSIHNCFQKSIRIPIQISLSWQNCAKKRPQPFRSLFFYVIRTEWQIAPKVWIYMTNPLSIRMNSKWWISEITKSFAILFSN